VKFALSTSGQSFVAYGEMMGIKPSRPLALMGHTNKSMTDRVYSKCIEELERNTAAIKDYCSEDY
jgi:hypothetical protein